MGDVPQQLQVVGELCTENGHAVVSAMGDTILYTVNPKRPQTELYDLKVLTVVTDHVPDYGMDTEYGSQPTEDIKCSVGDETHRKTGFAGHVILTYKSGGQLVTSMGHWIELTRIDTSLEAVLRTAAHNFGAAEVADFQREYDEQTSDLARYECVQKRSKALVSKSM